MLICAVNEQTLHCKCFPQDGQCCSLLASKKNFFWQHHSIWSRWLPFCGLITKHILLQASINLQVSHCFYAHHRDFHLMMDVCTLIFVAYIAMLSAAQNIKHWMVEWLVNIYWKGCGRKWSDQTWSTILAFAWRGWGTLQFISIRIVSALPRLKPTTSQIQLRNITTWDNFLCTVHTSQDTSVSLSLNHGYQVTASPDVSQILLPSITHFFSSYFYITFPTSVTSTLKKEAVYFPKNTGTHLPNAWCHDPDDHNIQAGEKVLELISIPSQIC
jgi:hypothetical protein